MGDSRRSSVEEKIRKLFDEWGVEHRLDLTELDISDIRKLIEVLDVKNKTTKDTKFPRAS